jgi:hypothetical protein
MNGWALILIHPGAVSVGMGMDISAQLQRVSVRGALKLQWTAFLTGVGKESLLWL